ncbi:MAG: ubiquinol-cytochrome c reductase iron-sulfur subunit [Leptolyngbyaceae cyanobacterium CRU_2_3]|nr:ubiquinol-cytochrome c reductase iron-sulfur subunit [Leptolyngbyaceae cyanobacterium CRU_2_3]
MNRRDFLNGFGLVGISFSLPFAIAACSSRKEGQSASNQPNQTASAAATLSTPRADGFTAVSSLSALKNSVSGVIAPPEVDVVLVSHSTNPDIPFAVSPRCTHTACTVEWHKNMDAFVCPCHGARFDSTGKVLRGPAEKPLQAYAVKVEGDDILVQIV